MKSHRRSRFASIPWVVLYIGGALGIGFAVPVLIESTDADRLSERYRFLLRLAIGIWLGSGLLALIVTLARRKFWPPLLNEDGTADTQGTASPQRATLRHLMIGVTLFCLVLVAARWLGPQESWWLVWITMVMGLVYAVSAGVESGIRFATLLAGLYFPFAWLFAFNVPWGYTSGLIEELPRAPGLIPAILLRGLGAEVDGQSRSTVAAVITAVLIAGGTVAVRQRGVLAVIVLGLALVVSTLGSLMAHVLYRM